MYRIQVYITLKAKQNKSNNIFPHPYLGSCLSSNRVIRLQSYSYLNTISRTYKLQTPVESLKRNYWPYELLNHPVQGSETKLHDSAIDTYALLQEFITMENWLVIL